MSLKSEIASVIRLNCNSHDSSATTLSEIISADTIDVRFLTPLTRTAGPAARHRAFAIRTGSIPHSVFAPVVHGARCTCRLRQWQSRGGLRTRHGCLNFMLQSTRSSRRNLDKHDLSAHHRSMSARPRKSTGYRIRQYRTY